MRWISALTDIPRGAWCGEPLAWLFDGTDFDSYGQVRWAPEDMRDSAAVGGARGARRLSRLARIRILAAHAIGAHPDGIHMERRTNRGIRIVAPESIYVSDASRGAWGAVAIARAPVGIDVEELPPERPLPLDLLHAAEREFLCALDPSMRGRTFLRFWSAREAYLKAVEGSLADSLETICAFARDDEIVELKRNDVSLGLVRTITRESWVAALAIPDWNEPSG